MKRFRRVLTLLLCLAARTGAAGPGDLDPGFGSAGRVQTPLGGGFANAIVALPDGSVVVGGGGDPHGTGSLAFVLARYDARGRLEPRFGDGGVVVLSMPGIETAAVQALALDAAGRIVVAGVAFTPGQNGPLSALHTARYFPDGTLDRDFSATASGVRQVGFADRVAGVASGRRTVFAVTNGDVFGEAALFGGGASAAAFPPPSAAGDVIPTPEGGEVFVGTADGHYLVHRSLPGFALDPTFGGGGIVRTAIGDEDRPAAVLLEPGGRIVVAGTTVRDGDADVVVVRYAPDGALDAGFGDEGVMVTPLGRRLDEASDAVLAGDGSILVAGGTCDPPAPCDGFVIRYRPDGTLDPAFGEGGVAIGRTAPIVALAMPDDGHVVAVTQDAEGFVLSRIVVATCGNGLVETGEECDDGNALDGDCCSAACTIDADGSPCAGDESACTVDVCRAGTCEPTVPFEAGCLLADASALVHVTGRRTGDRLRWTWQSAAIGQRSLFGDPAASTDVTLCVFEADAEASRPLLELTVPSGAQCDDGPCWRGRPRGFRYRDATGRNDGMSLLKLAARPDGTRIDLRVQRLPAPRLSVPLGVRLLLGDTPICFDAVLRPQDGAAFRFRNRR